MDFARDTIKGVKTTITILLVIVVASVIGVSVTSFEILLFGVSVASIIGFIVYILYILNKDSDNL
jgi:hypothetical protein